MGTISKALLYTSIFLSGYISGCLSCARIETSYRMFSRNDSQQKISDIEKRLNNMEKKLENGRN